MEVVNAALVEKAPKYLRPLISSIGYLADVGFLVSITQPNGISRQEVVAQKCLLCKDEPISRGIGQTHGVRVDTTIGTGLRMDLDIQSRPHLRRNLGAEVQQGLRPPLVPMYSWSRPAIM